MTKQAKTKKNELLKRNVFTVLLAVSKCEAVSAQMPDFFFFLQIIFSIECLLKKQKTLFLELFVINIYFDENNYE